MAEKEEKLCQICIIQTYLVGGSFSKLRQYIDEEKWSDGRGMISRFLGDVTRMRYWECIPEDLETAISGQVSKLIDAVNKKDHIESIRNLEIIREQILRAIVPEIAKVCR